MNKYGAKVSPDYQDVSDVEDKDTSLDGDYNCMKTRIKGTYTVPAGSGLVTITIPHNIGGIPLALSYIENADGSMTEVTNQDWGNGGVDATNLYVDVIKDPSRSILITYFLFVNSGGF